MSIEHRPVLFLASAALATVALLCLAGCKTQPQPVYGAATVAPAAPGMVGPPNAYGTPPQPVSYPPQPGAPMPGPATSWQGVPPATTAPPTWSQTGPPASQTPAPAPTTQPPPTIIVYYIIV